MSAGAPLIRLRPMALAVCLVVVLAAVGAHATAAMAVGRVTSYPIPAPSGVQSVTPYAVTAAGDGRLWFIAGRGNGAFVGRMGPDGRVGPADEILLPDAQGSQVPDLVGITVGPDSDIWASHDVGYVAHVPLGATRTVDVADYTDFAHAPGKLVAGPDSRLWFATPGAENGAISTAGAFNFYATGATHERRRVLGLGKLALQVLVDELVDGRQITDVAALEQSRHPLLADRRSQVLLVARG